MSGVVFERGRQGKKRDIRDGIFGTDIRDSHLFRSPMSSPFIKVCAPSCVCAWVGRRQALVVDPPAPRGAVTLMGFSGVADYQAHISATSEGEALVCAGVLQVLLEAQP